MRTYALVSQIPQYEIYGLIAQIRRASISIISNITEGEPRKSVIERKRYCEISKYSIVELDTQIEIPLELGFIKEITSEYDELIIQVFSMLSKMTK